LNKDYLIGNPYFILLHFTCKRAALKLMSFLMNLKQYYIEVTQDFLEYIFIAKVL